ncbi:MAG: alpha/beta hydrolase [Chloroflexi bacterium]|nr:alpha/beta hydrolase [Chloroflexota bacterium]
MQRLLRFLLALGAAALGLLAARDTIERSFIYFPARDLITTPADAGLRFEDVFFTAADGVPLHGWFVPGTGSVTWFWFHGNGGNISHRVPDIHTFHDKLGVNIFIFDYRGYGRSGGTPSEEGLYRDAEAALEVLRNRRDVDMGALLYFGRSLGAAVAIELATHHPPSGLVVEGAFGSVPAMARHAYPFLPVGPLLRTRYDSLRKIQTLEVPLLVIHAERDEVVPLEMGRRLFEAAREPKRFFLVTGAHHNDTATVGGDHYLSALEDFVRGLSG